MRLSVVDNFQSLSFNDSRSCVHETQFNPKIDSLSMNTAFCWFTVKIIRHNTIQRDLFKQPAYVYQFMPNFEYGITSKA